MAYTRVNQSPNLKAEREYITLHRSIFMKEDKVSVQDILDTTDRTRVKLSKIGAAILRHIQKYDDVVIVPAEPLENKLIPQRSDL